MSSGKEELMEKSELERIYNKYFDTVYKVCFLYMKRHADAQDMTQETFCQLINKPFLYESDEKTKAWLIVSASNICKNHLKKWWVKKSVSFEDTIMEKRSIDETTSDAERANEVYRTVMGLDQKYALPTYLYYYEGYKTSEIACMLKTTPSTVQTRLAKARKLLRMEFE